MKSELLLGLLVGACCWTTGSASAGCGDRPGTPNNVTMTALSPTAVQVTWRNTTGKGLNPSGSTSHDPTHKMFFDMYFRDGSNNPIGRDPPAGTGPLDVNYGMISRRTFDGLAANTRYCFALKTRTEGGTQGCVSALASNWACATTLKAGEKASPPPTSQASASAAPHLSIQGQPDNRVVLSGNGFKASSSVTIRAVNRNLNQILVTSIGGAPIRTSGAGSLNVTLQGFCKVQGDRVSFTATDGRPDPGDRITGSLWNNAVSVDCT